MLAKANSVIKRVIKGRPTVQYYIQRYRGDKIWQSSNNYSNDFDVKYIVYLQNEQHKPKLRLEHAVSKLFNDIQYFDRKKTTSDSTRLDTQIINDYKRKKGILRKSQLHMLDNYDIHTIKSLQLQL